MGRPERDHWKLTIVKSAPSPSVPFLVWPVHHAPGRSLSSVVFWVVSLRGLPTCMIIYLHMFFALLKYLMAWIEIFYIFCSDCMSLLLLKIS